MTPVSLFMGRVQTRQTFYLSEPPRSSRSMSDDDESIPNLIARKSILRAASAIR